MKTKVLFLIKMSLFLTTSTTIIAQNSSTQIKAFSDIYFGAQENQADDGKIIDGFKDKNYAIAGADFEVNYAESTEDDGLWEISLHATGISSEAVLKKYKEVLKVLHDSYGDYKEININIDDEMNKYSITNHVLAEIWDSQPDGATKLTDSFTEYYPGYFYSEFQKQDLTLKFGFQKYEYYQTVLKTAYVLILKITRTSVYKKVLREKAIKKE